MIMTILASRVIWTRRGANMGSIENSNRTTIVFHLHYFTNANYERNCVLRGGQEKEEAKSSQCLIEALTDRAHLHVNILKWNCIFQTMNIISMSMWTAHVFIHSCCRSSATSSHLRETMPSSTPMIHVGNLMWQILELSRSAIWWQPRFDEECVTSNTSPPSNMPPLHIPRCLMFKK